VTSRRKLIASLARASAVCALGAETSADLTVRWTNGATQTFPGVAADQLVTIREGAGIIRKQKFR
jgi:hypothetical protein